LSPAIEPTKYVALHQFVQSSITNSFQSDKLHDSIELSTAPARERNMEIDIDLPDGEDLWDKILDVHTAHTEGRHQMAMRSPLLANVAQLFWPVIFEALNGDTLNSLLMQRYALSCVTRQSVGRL
jgi:hypothetical protein